MVRTCDNHFVTPCSWAYVSVSQKTLICVCKASSLTYFLQTEENASMILVHENVLTSLQLLFLPGPLQSSFYPLLLWIWLEYETPPIREYLLLVFVFFYCHLAQYPPGSGIYQEKLSRGRILSNADSYPIVHGCHNLYPLTCGWAHVNPVPKLLWIAFQRDIC